MCLLLSRGHADVYEYGWGWFTTCLEAVGKMQQRESRQRMHEIRAAQHADAKTWRKLMLDK